jgi:hypothetical protein
VIKFENCSTRAAWLMAVLLSTLAVAGCGSAGRSQILGIGAGETAIAPRVTAVTPINAAAGVAINSAITASFTEDMAPTTLNTATFTLTCAAPCVAPAGTVVYAAGSRAAVFTPTQVLAIDTTYTATITVGATSVAGTALAGNQAPLPASSDYVWRFTTGATSDTTRPRVTFTVPVTTIPGPTPGVPSNTAIVASFSEDMNPATITAATFTVTCAAPCVAPAGNVTYALGSQTATFTPTAALAADVTYTVTITSAATDVAANALAGNQAALPAASDYIWSFSTVTAVAAGNVSVHSTNPLSGETGVCPDATINATFNVPPGLRINPATVNATTFTVTGPAPAVTSVTAGSVVLDAATGLIATFTPQVALEAGQTYTATVLGGANGVEDLAVPGNEMVGNFTWSFTAGPATGKCLAPIALASAAPFATYGGTAGMTNTGTLTVINGDIGTIATGTSSITGFNDTAGDVYTETGANIGTVNGTIYTCTNSTTGPTSTGPNAAYCSIATQARLDAQKAYLAMTALAPGANPGGNLAGLTLAPGVYTAPAGSFLIQGGDLTLNGQGNANAVWVFQMSTTLTVGGPGAAFPQSVILTGGAQAKNVFWQVGSNATINAAGGGTMVGTIISQQGAEFSTAGNTDILTLNGRVMSLIASVTLVDTVINVPAP